MHLYEKSIPDKLIIDTGFLLAIFNEKDEHHNQAVSISEHIDASSWYTTVFVLHELFQLLAKRTNIEKAIDCFEALDEMLTIPELPSNWSSQATQILKKFSKSKIDLADASLVVLADSLKIPHIVSVDRRDFTLLRWNSGKSHFENLFFYNF